MKNKLIKLLIFSSIFFLLIFLILTYTSESEKVVKYSTPECEQATVPGICYYQHAEEIIKTQGIESAIQYLNDALEYSNYNNIHIALHAVGNYAYTYAGDDLVKALSYLPADGLSNEKYFDNDGYLHGLFQYFFEDSQGKTIQELMKAACDENDFISSDLTLAADDCYHGVGHALMYMNDNNLTTSLAQCDLAKDSIVQNRCYYGVFMEQSFLYSLDYHPESARPYQEETLATFCNNTKKRYQYECAHFTGHGYLIANPGDFNGAFEVCRQFDTEVLIKSCISRFAFFEIPAYFRTGLEIMKVTCSLAGPELEEFCWSQVEKGIEFGTAG